MPKYTLLTVVQKALDSTNSFEVDSIDDTPEAQAIAGFAEDVYQDFISELGQEWQYKERLLSLESSLDDTKPNYMKIPSGVTKIKESVVQYNIDTEGGLKYQDIQYLYPQDFLEMTSYQHGSTQQVQDYSGTVYDIFNDRMPKYFTTFDGDNLAFDAFDLSVENTLQETKTRFIGTQETPFYRTDDFIIPLPNDLLASYLAMVKAKASEYLQGEPLVSDIRKGTAGLVKARMKNRIGGVETYSRRKNYGRK